MNNQLAENEKRRQRRRDKRKKVLNSLLELQGGVCAICRKIPRSKWQIDHDHTVSSSDRATPDSVRGVLCTLCNVQLGWLERHQNDIASYLNPWRVTLARKVAR